MPGVPITYTVSSINDEKTPRNVSDSASLVTRLRAFWFHFRQYPGGIVGACFFLLILFISIFAPIFTLGTSPNTTYYQVVGFGEHGPSLQQLPFRIFGLTTGADLRHSVYILVLYAGRITLLIGCLTAFLSSMIGTLLGAISGYFGGWLESAVTRTIEVISALPFLPLSIAITIATGQVLTVPLLIGIFTAIGWSSVARIVRASILIITAQEYIESARSAGINEWRIMLRHVIPNVTGPIIVATILNVSTFIVAESTLDYLQIGVQNTLTWGSMIANAKGYMLAGNWWWVFFPGAFIIITVLSLNFLGEALRQTFNVRERTI